LAKKTIIFQLFSQKMMLFFFIFAHACAPKNRLSFGGFGQFWPTVKKTSSTWPTSQK
jgi:hypothetical protein